MPRGGARPGAGRPKGSGERYDRAQDFLHTTNTRIGKLVPPEGFENTTPLDVILYAMKMKLAEGDVCEAAKFAQAAAPYCHARLQQVAQVTTVIERPETLTTEQLHALIQAEIANPLNIPVEATVKTTVSERDRDR